MSLHHRKFLYAEEPDKSPEPDQNYASPCYMCYVCPKDCYISPPPPPPPPWISQPSSSHKQHQISTILILMLCILGFAFLVLSYLTIGRYRNSRRRTNSVLQENGNLREDFLDENQGPHVVDHPIWYIRTVGFPQSTIDSISMFKYKKGEGLIEGCDCSVCLNEFQEDESLRLLPKCSHAFHVNCIDIWLRSHKNCPVCRAPILTNTGNNNNTHVNSVELSSSNSGSVEETDQVRIELENQRMDQVGETRDVTEDRSLCLIPEDKSVNMSSRIERFRVLSDLADRHRVKLDRELQRNVRRSVSMDFSSSSVTYSKKDEGCSDIKQESVERQNSDMIVKRICKNSSFCRIMMVKSSSYGRSSLQKGPISMKRSLSFSGKRSLRKSSRSHDSISIIPLEHE